MIGQIISHYEILEKLGEGGMGVVYKARDALLDRFVALKFLPSQFTQDKERRERFITEAKAASALDHPNICTIHEINETDDGQLYICMAFYEGQTLKEKIKDKSLSGLGMETGLKIKEIHDYTIQIAQGLQRAHEKGIIHRDIKPANIMITGRGEVKILDFGLAKLAGAELTESISTKGTIAYMSPEIIRGLPVDQRSDIWSLGVVLYEMLTGERPFKGDYAEPMMYAILNEAPESVGNNREEISGLLEAIIEKLLQKDPVMRYQNLDEFLSDSRKYKPELAGSDKRVIQKKLKGIPIKKITVIGFSLILIVGILLLYNKIFNSSIIKPKPVAVISFENQTGEEEYNYLQKAIPNLLITNLEQSGYLTVATWERLNDLLEQKGIKDIETIDPDLGFEICQLGGIETIIIGSYTKAGEVFALDIKVLDVISKELLQSASSRGHGISSILTSQIDELSENIFRELGVSKMTSEPTRPISDVTTNSMEAYNYFIRGREELEKRNIESSRQFLEKAVKLDTTFASAYSHLGIVYNTLANQKAGNEAFQKAKYYSHKATEKERLYIEAECAAYLENNIEKRLNLELKIIEKYPQEKRAHLSLAYYYYTKRKLYDQALERYYKVLELDPNFGLAYNMLAFTYMEMGEYEKAIGSFERYASINPGDSNVFDSLGELYLRIGDIDQALVKYKEATEVQLKYLPAYSTIAYIYALKEDYNQTMKWIDRYIKIAPSQGIKARGHLHKGFYCFWMGRFEHFLQELQSATECYNDVENQHGLAAINWAKGWFYFYRGDTINGLKYFKKWFNFREILYPQFTPSHKTEFLFFVGITELGADKVDSTEARLEEMKELLSEVDSENMDRLKFYHDILYAEFLLSQDSIEKVLKYSEKLSHLQIPPIGPVSLIYYNLPFPLLRDISARAYQHSGKLDKAITEYENLIHFNPKCKERRLIHPTYYFKLAKLFEEIDNLDRAIESYQKFLEIWRKADEGLPEVIEAKKSLNNFKI